MRIMILMLLITGLFIFAGCEKAEVRFVSEYAGEQGSARWSVAMSKDEIVTVVPQLDMEFNTQSVSNNKLNKLLIFNWLQVNEEGVAQIRPGVYDWLIVLDSDGNGKVDSYYGTLASDVQLHRYKFVGGKHYKAIVHDKSRVEFIVD